MQKNNYEGKKITNEQGIVKFENLKKENYYYVVERKGYSTYKENIKLDSNQKEHQCILYKKIKPKELKKFPSLKGLKLTSEYKIKKQISKHRPIKNNWIPEDVENKVGATHVGGKYHLTGKPFIIEGSNKIRDMGSIKDLEHIAKNLYTLLREADQRDFELVLIEEVPKRGIGEAVMNRLKKAAVKII